MKAAWLFPGQGSQSVGMAKDVLEASPAARAIFERADAALAGAWEGGGSLSRIVFSSMAPTRR
jgi:[acyl-carrier-protein] S-malonyltransferase